ncbi:hypothetical protein BV210_08805 [Halorientalis sp. IM1011]|uniref:hypothetical protein n=1 Tax=Halorientalis sp. IM1011 TaxID=1932360 RepID=UPI00097CC0CF|nr:hypothetical protein [Halorientalis sp. IM1011]AQL42803.1 hypothetical protein BV210_08805 [Halorientalis sp. IM1011]
MADDFGYLAVDTTDMDLSEFSPEEARRHRIRQIVRQDMEAHEEIYDDLAREYHSKPTDF